MKTNRLSPATTLNRSSLRLTSQSRNPKVNLMPKTAPAQG
jgi:hypothetical protein